MKLAAGLVLAGISAIALNCGFFAQHRAARRMPRLLLRRPLRSLRLLFTSPGWLTGYATGIGGWGLYIAALVLAPLSLVQATSAGGVGVLAVLVARTEGDMLASWERAGVGAALAGLALLGLSLVGHASGGDRGSLGGVVLWVTVSAGLAGLAMGLGRKVLAPGAGYGAAAGLLYAAGDVATKAAVGGGGRLAFLGVVAACHGTAFVSLQMGFQRGRALSTAGVSTVLTNALPIAAGIVLFREVIPHSALGALRVAAFAAVVVGAGLLVGKGRSQPAAARDDFPSSPSQTVRAIGAGKLLNERR
jgi:hypothetical protein